MRNPQHWMIVGGLLLVGAPAAHAATSDSGQFSLSAGANYSSGKYGTTATTDIWSVPVTAEYDVDRWTFKLVVPYINISGADNVIPGVGKVKNNNPNGRGHGKGGLPPVPGTTTTGSASGLGDVTASAGYELFTNADRTAGLDLTGKVKFGTADENKGLGTGKNDYGLSLDTYKVMGDWTAFGGVGWMKYTSSQYIQLKNGFNANVGMGYKLGGSDDIGAYYYYRERIATGGAPQSEVTGYWNHKFNDSLRLQAYVLGGFANGSPDYGVGASLKFSF
ncbi:transporter [Rhodanobacter denitrificans]|uniref:Transporter n=1 Tax=Rhodanobacter denitrificans TaxID=666685 RepID=A0A368KCB3_9GAMM|nr:transporter [Rhodanobacter denitrificans]RCS29467.1 transporter [Rhodanobacter denitrificans]